MFWLFVSILFGYGVLKILDDSPTQMSGICLLLGMALGFYGLLYSLIHG